MSIIQYSLYDGIRISDQKQFSIFEIKSDPTSPLQQSLSKNAVKIWKTFRHPSIPTFYDTYENEGNTYIVTEKLLPFNYYNLIYSNTNESFEEDQKNKLSDDEIVWAVHTLADFVCFIGERGNAIHGNIQNNSLFMTYGHELKIAGLHWMTVNGIGPIQEFYNDYQHLILDVNHIQPNKEFEVFIDPRVTLDELSITKSRDKTMEFYSTIDSKFIGLFIERYKCQLPERIINYGSFWSSNYFVSYLSYFSTNGNMPLTPKMLLEDNFCWNSPAKKNEFMQTILFLKDLPLKDVNEREIFFQKLNKILNIFSIQTQEHTILPILISSLSYAESAAEKPLILETIFSISSNSKISTESFEKVIIPTIIPLFENKDRNLRMHLLKNIGLLMNHFPNKLVNEVVFPNVLIGLNDTVSSMRSSTIISMVSIAPKLNKDNNKILVRELRKLQCSDQDGSIRCNSIICMTKIAETIDDEIRLQTLLSTFVSATKDPFAQTRKAAIAGFKYCRHIFSSSCQIISNNILVALAPLCNDESVENRILAIKTMNEYLGFLLSINDPESKELNSFETESPEKLENSNESQDKNTPNENNHIYDIDPNRSVTAFPPPPPGMFQTNAETDDNELENKSPKNYFASSPSSFIAHYPSREESSNQNKPRKVQKEYDEDEYWNIIKSQPPKPAKSQEVKDAMMLFSTPQANKK